MESYSVSTCAFCASCICFHLPEKCFFFNLFFKGGVKKEKKKKNTKHENDLDCYSVRGETERRCHPSVGAVANVGPNKRRRKKIVKKKESKKKGVSAKSGVCTNGGGEVVGEAGPGGGGREAGATAEARGRPYGAGRAREDMNHGVFTWRPPRCSTRGPQYPQTARRRSP